MATYTNKKKDGPKRWRGQVTIQGKVVASKWLGSAKADKNLAIAWEVEKKKELEETAKQLPTPLDSAPQPKTLTILQWATAYLGAFSEVSDAFSALSNRRPINVIPFRESQTLAQSPTQAQNSARVPGFGSKLNIPATPAIVLRRRQSAPAGTAPLSSTGSNGKG